MNTSIICTSEAEKLACATVLSELHVLELWMPQFVDTRNCNLSCKHCYVAKGGMSAHAMEPEIYAEAMHTLATKPEFNHMGRFDVVFPGMEPLLRKNRPWFQLLASEAVSLGKGSVGITTNGTLLDDETILFLSGLASKCKHPFTVNVSLDGDEAIHDEQRGAKGLWRKTTFGIERLAKASSCNLVTNTTITSLNVSSLPDIARISKRCGTNIAAFHPFEAATNSGLRTLTQESLIAGIKSLIDSFKNNESIGNVVLEFEASSAGTFFSLFERGAFDGCEIVEDDTGFLFLRKQDVGKQLLISLMFHPHHFIRTMRLLHNGGFASCRSIALDGWETVGDWRMSVSELKDSCMPCLAKIWQEYLDSTAIIRAETFEAFSKFILKGGD